MAYRALDLDDIPHLETSDVLKTRNISIHQATDVLKTAEKNHGILVKLTTSVDGKVLAAYADRRQSNKYPLLQIGITAELWFSPYDGRDAFEVDCHAQEDEEQYALRAHVYEYEDALLILLSFIDYAWARLEGKWSARPEPAFSEPVLDDDSEDGEEEIDLGDDGDTELQGAPVTPIKAKRSPKKRVHSIQR